MKCPKCGGEVTETAKFCISCGVNLEEARREEEEKRRLEEVARKAEEERKAKEEEERIAREKAAEEARRKEEEERKAKEEAERIEKEKQAAEEQKRLAEIREAEIKKAEEERRIAEEEIRKRKEEEEFKTVKEETKTETPKKEKKIKKKKGFFRRLFDRLILIVIIVALIVGGVYFLNKKELLPEFISKEVDDFIEKFEFVKDNWKNEDKGNKKESSKKEEKIEWYVEADIEADDIIDFTDEFSIIKVDGKCGLVDNESGKIVLDTKYKNIKNVGYYLVSDTNKTNKKTGIIISDGDKWYSVDSKYQKDEEVVTTDLSSKISNFNATEETKYYYDHYDEVVYECIGKEANKYVPVSKSSLSGESNLAVCTDMEIVTSEGKTAQNDDLTKEIFEIDMKKSKENYKGYFDLTTGKLVIDCNYEEAGEFIDGYAAVKTEDGKAWIIDDNGDKAVEYDFDETRSVHNGFAWAEKDGKWGIIEV